jgi:peroxiredoxin/predicted 2-oxoglutarate/Fe(II)-dependent dioxygenase YbiX
MVETVTTTLRVRDPSPPFDLNNQVNELVALEDYAGKPLVLVFYASDGIAACADIAWAFRDKAAEFSALGAKVVLISTDTPAARSDFAAKSHLPFQLLCDLDANISKKYGACYPNQSGDAVFVRLAFLLNINQRIIKIYKLSDLESPVEDILGDISSACQLPEPHQIYMQAPVLLIPNVLSEIECRKLIEIWETQGHSDSGFMVKDGEKTVGYLDPRHKLRSDHFLADGGVKNYLDWVMQRRIFPEIKKAFDYDASRREEYKIACYDASRGGYFRTHRDNTTPGTAHRKFAMTLNLNAEEYEGGYLRFPEYGPHVYKPSTGSAVIFSCSLLHEATDVTVGSRFALLSFFYGEAEGAMREVYEKKFGSNQEVISSDR